MSYKEKNIKGIWIPIEILDDPELNWTDKGIYSIVYFLSNDGLCYVSNKYLADKVNVTDRTVRSVISKLCEMGYLKKEMSSNNRVRSLKVKPIDLKFEGGSRNFHPENISASTRKIFPQGEENISTYNNSTISTNNNIVDNKDRPESIEVVCDYFTHLGLNGIAQEEAEKFFDYYTSNGWKVGKNPMKDWRATARNWKKGVKKDRYDKEGEGKKVINDYTEEDFLKAIIKRD
jgi:hypothetical protein